MYDAVLVLVETFNKLLWKKPDMFKMNTKRMLSNGNSSVSSISPSQILGLDCNSGRTSENQWEHGEKISRFLRKVRKYVGILNQMKYNLKIRFVIRIYFHSIYAVMKFFIIIFGRKYIHKHP